jgi:hypothetical protein
MYVLELRDLIRNSTAPADIPLTDWDPYGTTSSFYGPGAFLCWLLVSISYLAKWAATRPLPASLFLASDYVAMLAYPLIAAGDVVLRAAALSPAQRPRLMATLLAVRGAMNATMLTPEVATDMDTLRACVGLSAPLRVCEVFLWPGLHILLSVLLEDKGDGKAYLRWPLLLPDVAFITAYVGLIGAVVVVAAVGTPGPVGWYFGQAMTTQCMSYIIAATPGILIYVGMKLAEPFGCDDFAAFFFWLLWVIVLAVLAGVFIAPLIIFGVFPAYVVELIALLAPDSGVGMGELDQAAAVGVGVIAFGITMYEVGKKIPRVARFVRECMVRLGLLREVTEEEIPLTGDSEVSQTQDPPQNLEV